MPKKRSDYVIFEEPLIDISMEPTEEVDPLFIDPTAESINNDAEDEFELNGFSIFSPKVGVKKSFSPPEDKEVVKIKKEAIETEVKVKEEPKDLDDEFGIAIPKDDEVDPVEALAKALDKVEFLCPKCTYRSTDKEDVTQHFVTSHRVFQVGIPRPCDKCDYVGKTVRELAAHKKASHPRTYLQDNLPTLPTGEFKCPHCDFVSFHKNNVRSHMKVHTQDTVYTCDKCPYTAISRLNIENHSSRHLLKRSRKWKFKCKHCGLLERTEKLLQRHLILHGEGEMVKCQLCPYKSPYNHIISMHTRICHGIVGKRSWDKEEKWKMRVRKSTRQCARKRYTFGDETEDDFQEEFLELPIKKSNRGRKKQSFDNSKEPDEVTVKKEEEDKQEGENEKSQGKPNISDTIKKTEEVIEAPRRPTLEERLGRARELINKNLSRKKVKLSNDSDQGGQSKTENEEKNKTQVKNEDKKKANEAEIEESDGENQSNHSGTEEENESDDNYENPSEEEESGSKDDDWSEEEGDFYPDTAEESMQSFSSDKAHLESTNNSSHRDTENSMTDSESLSRAESTEGKTETHVKRRTAGVRNKKRARSRSDNEKESSENEEINKRSRTDKQNERKTNNEDNTAEENNEENIRSVSVNSNSENALDKSTENSDNDEQQDESVRLVLKRKGSSFTCIPKNNLEPS